jgi:hypothetical protein
MIILMIIFLVFGIAAIFYALRGWKWTAKGFYENNRDSEYLRSRGICPPEVNNFDEYIKFMTRKPGFYSIFFFIWRGLAILFGSMMILVSIGVIILSIVN